VGIGTFSIIKLTGKIGSPFNVRDTLSANFFTLDEVKQLFAEYETAHKLKLDQRVVEDIYDLTSGYVLRDIF
jgi:hypothetical protein